MTHETQLTSLSDFATYIQTLYPSIDTPPHTPSNSLTVFLILPFSRPSSSPICVTPNATAPLIVATSPPVDSFNPPCQSPIAITNPAGLPAEAHTHSATSLTLLLFLCQQHCPFPPAHTPPASCLVVFHVPIQPFPSIVSLKL